MTKKQILLILAMACFILAVVIIIGDGSLKHSGALVPAGLTFFVASFLFP